MKAKSLRNARRKLDKLIARGARQRRINRARARLYARQATFESRKPA